MMDTQTWFPTPIYLHQTPLNVRKELKQELLGICNTLSFEHVEGWQDNTHRLNVDPFAKNILTGSSFLDYLHIHINQYITDIGGRVRPYYIEHSWFTKTDKGQYAHQHAHGSSDIAGVYYVQTNGKDGDLWFQPPHAILQSNYIMSEIQMNNNVPPKEGKLLLWPGFLQHGVRQNTTNSERISLSFNIQIQRYVFKLDYGTYNEVFKDTLTVSRREVQSSGKVAAVPPRPFPGKRI